MAEFKHGTMDVRVQEKTFEGFIKVAVRSLMAIFVILLIMVVFGA